MPKVNCAVVGYSSRTYGINKWNFKEPCLEHGDKSVVNGQCSNCERSLMFSSWDDKRQKERCIDSGSQTRKSEQNKMDPKKQW